MEEKLTLPTRRATIIDYSESTRVDMSTNSWFIATESELKISKCVQESVIRRTIADDSHAVITYDGKEAVFASSLFHALQVAELRGYQMLKRQLNKAIGLQ